MRDSQILNNRLDYYKEYNKRPERKKAKSLYRQKLRNLVNPPKKVDLFTAEDIETLFKVEQPLQELLKGYGYMGVLLRNTTTDKLQCHICGSWFKSLSQHCISNHKILSKDYKKKFQLPLSHGLVAVSTSSKLSNSAIKKGTVRNLTKIRKSRIKKIRKKDFFNYFRNNASFQNKRGICEAQINRRYLVVSDMVGREASQRDINKYDPSLLSTIKRKYGNLNNFRKRKGYEIKKAIGKMTDDYLIACLRKFYFIQRKIPREIHFRKGSPTSQTIRKHFGSWSKALQIAGFDKTGDFYDRQSDRN